MFFRGRGLSVYDSVTELLIETGVPSFDSVLHSSHAFFKVLEYLHSAAVTSGA